MILDGKKLAKKIEKQIKSEVLAVSQKTGHAPGLATIQIGQMAASSVYVQKKHEACGRVGVYSEKIEFPENIEEKRVLDEVLRLNESEKIHGILVQLPLPKHLDSQRILQVISPAKDVDGFHVVNIGRLHMNGTGLVPCTPQGVLALIDEYQIPVRGKHAVVVGRSLIVGKPVAQLLLGRDATVTIAHSKSEDLASICKSADILVAACGQPELISAKWIKPGACVIDVGIHRNAQGKIVGDVLFEEVSQVAGYISPVPGGVGPLTIAMLLKNTLKAFKDIYE